MQTEETNLKEILFAVVKLLADKKVISWDEVDELVSERRHTAGEKEMDHFRALWEAQCATGEAVKLTTVENMSMNYVFLRSPKSSIRGVAGSIPNAAHLLGMSVGQELELDGGRGGFVLEAVYRPKAKVLPPPPQSRQVRRAAQSSRGKRR